MEELKKSNKIPGSCDVFTRPEEIKELSKYLGDLKRSYDESLTLDKTKEKVSEVKDIRNLPNTLDILNSGKASAEPLLRVGRDSLDIEKGKVTIRPDRINQVTGKLSKLGITSLSEIDTRIKRLGGEGLKEVSIRGDKELLNSLGELRDLKVDIERLNPLELSKVSEHLEKIRTNLPVDSLSSRIEKLGGVWTSQVGPDTELDKLMVSRKDTQLEDDIESLRADQIRSLIARKENLAGTEEIDNLLGRIEKLTSDGVISLSEGLEKIKILEEIRELSLGREDLKGMEGIENLSKHLEKLISNGEISLSEGLEKIKALNEIRDLVTLKENLSGIPKIDNLSDRLEKLVSIENITLSEGLEMIRAAQGNPELEASLERIYRSDDPNLEDYKDLISFPREYRLDLPTGSEEIIDDRKEDLSNLLDYLNDNRPDPSLPNSKESLTDPRNFTRKDIADDSKQIYTVAKEVTETLRPIQDIELEKSQEKVKESEVKGLSDETETIKLDPEARLELEGEKEELVSLGKKPTLSKRKEEIRNVEPVSKLPKRSETIVAPEPIKKLDETPEKLTVEEDDLELEKDREIISGKSNWNGELEGVDSKKPIENLGKLYEDLKKEAEGKGGKAFESLAKKEDLETTKKIHNLPEESENLIDERVTKLSTEREDIKGVENPIDLPEKSDRLRDSREVTLESPELKEVIRDKRTSELEIGKERLHVENSKKTPEIEKELPESSQLEGIKITEIKLPETTDEVLVGPKDTPVHLSDEKEEITDIKDIISLPGKGTIRKPSVAPNNDIVLSDIKELNPNQTEWDGELEGGNEDLPGFQKTIKLEDQKELNPDQTGWDGRFEEGNEDLPGGPKSVHLSEYQEKNPDTTDWEGGLESYQEKNPNRTEWKGGLEDYQEKNPDTTEWDENLENHQEKNPDTTRWDGNLEDHQEANPDETRWSGELEDHQEKNPDQTEWNRSLEDYQEKNPDTTSWKGDLEDHQEKNPDTTGWDNTLEDYQEKNPDKTDWDENLEDYQEKNPDKTNWDGSLEDYQEKNPDTTGWDNTLEDHQEKNPDTTGWNENLENHQEKNPDVTGWDNTLEDHQEKNLDVTGWDNTLEDHQEKNPDVTSWKGDLEDYQEKNPDTTGWNSALEDYLDERPEGDNWSEKDGIYTEESFKGTSIYSHADENISGISNDEDWTSSDEFPTDKLLRPDHSSKINPGKNFIIDTQTDDEEIQKDDYVNTPYTKAQYEETVAWKVTDESPTGQSDHAQWTEGDGLYTKGSFKGTDVYSHTDENTSGISNDEDWTLSSNGFPTDKLLRPTHESKINPGKNYIIDTQTNDEEGQEDDYKNVPYTKSQYEKTVAWKLEDESPSGQTGHAQWTEEDGLEDTKIIRASHSSKINAGKNYKVDTKTTDEEIQEDDYKNVPYTKAQYEKATVWKVTDENTSGISNDEDWTSSDEFPTDKHLRPAHESKINPGKNYKVDTQTTDEEIQGDDYENTPYEKSQYEKTKAWKLEDESPSGQSDHAQWTKEDGLEDKKIIRAKHSSKINPGKNYIIDTKADDEKIQGDDYKNVLYTKPQYEKTVAWKLEDESPAGQTDHAQWTEDDGLYTKESFKETDEFAHEGEKPENQTDHSQWTKEDGLEDTKIIRAKHSSKINPGKNYKVDTKTTDEEIQGDDYKNVPYTKAQYEETVAWKLKDESPSGQTGHAQWSESTGLYDKTSEDGNGNPVSPGLKKSIYDEVADENLNIYYNNLIAFARNRSREAKQLGTVKPDWYEKVGGLISTHLSKSKVTEKDCKEFEKELFKTIIPSIVNDPGPWEKLIIDSSNAEGPINQTDWTGIANRDDNEDKFENMPHYHLPDNWLSLLDPSAFIRFLAEMSIGQIPSKKKGLGVLRKLLMDEALGAMVASRDLLERKVLKSNRDRLPGGDLKWWQGMNDAQDVVNKGINTLANLIGGQKGIDKSTPKNRPDDTEGGTYDALNLIGAIAKTCGATHLEEGNKKISFSKRYYTPALKRTLKELTDFNKDISSFKTLKELIADPERSNLTCANRYLMNPQTLDNNSHWEILLCPYLGKENGSCSYLPNIEWYNKINREQYAMDTFYTWNMPITSFEYSRTKQEQKSLPLFAGELSYPVGLEFINELRLTIVDDQFKTFRKYFEQVAEVSTYYSVVHNIEYYKNEPNEKTEFVSHDIHLVAPYKNITFECKIYCLTPQLNMIDCYDLLVVMKDFTAERSGDIQGEAGDLVVNFSVVGEDPEPNELLTDKEVKKYTTVGIQPSARVNDGGPKNKLGGLISSIATGGLKLL